MFNRLFLAAILASFCSLASATIVGVEAEVTAESEFGTTYRVYVTFDDPTDNVVAVYGMVTPEQNAPLTIATTTSFYQNGLGSNWGQGINPLVFAVDPNVMLDSWFTLGSESTEGSGGVQQVGMDDYLDAFELGDGFTIESFTGGSWFVIPGTSADAYATEDNRVLIAQLTTTGVVDMMLNVQYDDADGNTHNVDQLPLTFPTVPMGCMDVSACNYDEEAEDDDGSCAYPGDGCDDGDAGTVGDVYDEACACAGTPSLGGCTDESACNYSEAATTDDGSCTYPEQYEDCDGNCLSDLNDNGICDEEESFGCTTEGADNYDPDASTDNGSCVWAGGLMTGLSYEVYAEDGIAGMTTYRVYANFSSAELDVTAVFGTDVHPWSVTPTTSFYQDPLGANYGGDVLEALFDIEPSVEFDSWFTIGAEPGDDNSLNAVGMDPFLPSFEAGGELNVNTFTGGSIFLVPGASAQGYPVDGKVLLAQLTTDGSVMNYFNIQFRDGDDVTHQATGLPLLFPDNGSAGLGCTDEEALNYDPDAVFDDGSCEYAGPSYTALSYEVVATDMPTEGLTTYRVYANFDLPGDQLTAVFSQEGSPMHISTSSSFYQHEIGGAYANDLSAAIIAAFPEAAYDSWMTIGGDMDPIALLNVGMDAAADEFEAGGNMMVDNEVGASWFVLPDTEPLAFPDDQGRVLIAQLTTDGVVDIDVNLQYRAADLTNPQVFNQTLTFPIVILGCTDPLACNYDETAEANDGSCVYPEQYYDCNGDCITDTDGDEICDELEVPGCTDVEADNYDMNATDDDGTCEYLGCMDEAACNYDETANVDDGSCTYPEQYYDCDGNCINDTDGDGVCDELEVPGCMDVGADNYDSDATDDDGSCEYLGCTDPDADNYDETANVDDGSCVIGGCTYANASNYNENATYDDGSCVFPGCTDPEASNFSSLATVDDGTCEECEAADPCPFDVDGNGSVGSADLLEFLAAYGQPCD